LNTAKIGSQDQKYLNKSGDNIRIDWGMCIVGSTGTECRHFNKFTDSIIQ